MEEEQEESGDEKYFMKGIFGARSIFALKLFLVTLEMLKIDQSTRGWMFLLFFTVVDLIYVLVQKIGIIIHI